MVKTLERSACDDATMRRHGWSGNIPADDDEATSRIIAAARAAIDQHGSVSISEVAEVLTITRQTVYRYFPTVENLMTATALSAVDDFLDRLAIHMEPITDPTDAVVEGIAHTLEQLPDEKYLGLVMQPGKASAFTAGITSEVAIGFGRSILERFNVDWDAAGFTGARLDELVELMLRVLQSFMIDPGGPTRHGAELRGFLQRWIAPAVRAHSGALENS